MIMILKIVISAVAYLILAPFAGGLLTGMGRRFSSGLQAKRGASMMQPFRVVKKPPRKIGICTTTMYGRLCFLKSLPELHSSQEQICCL